MRIMYVSSSTSQQGGAELCMLKLVQHFGESSTVVLPKREGIAHEYEKIGVTTTYVPMKRMRRSGTLAYQVRFLVSTVTSALRLARLVGRQGVDLVHVNEFIDFQALIAGKLRGVRTVCHVRFVVDQPVWFKRFMVALVGRFADRIICVSDAVKRSMFGVSTLHSSKISVIHDGGPDMARFSPDSYDKQAVRQALGFGEQDCVVGLVSKFVEVKGHTQLVEAARQVYEKRIGGIHYLVVGGPVDGHEGYFGRVKALVQSYGMESLFAFTGYRADVPNLLNACDVVVHLPLYEDPFPGVVLEAMAMEKPVIAHRSGGIPEQIEDGVSGFLIPRGDLDSLVDLIVRLSRDKDLQCEVGKNARQHVLNNFSLEKHFAAIAAVYDSVLAGR